MPKRPPKPPDVLSKPRFKERKKSMSAIFEALTSLTQRFAGPEYLDEFFRQISGETNDRGAAILLGATVENGLDLALGRLLVRGSWSLLFGTEKALGSFRNKIHIAYSFGIFGDQTFANLEAIRKIRNAFAHARIPLTFDAPEVIAACDTLTVPLLVRPMIAGANERDFSDTHGLARYREVCTRTGHNLVMANMGGIIPLDHTAIPNLPEGFVHVIARQKPLP